ncbi:MAG: hypothetical protein R2852_07880 [Bacteroidia bacterium]
MSQDEYKVNNYISEFKYFQEKNYANEKRVSVDTLFSIDDKYISYSIFYQNSGSDTVNRVVIRDTVDQSLIDLSKFSLNWSKYPCEYVISGHVSSFYFDSIRLPFYSKSYSRSRAGFNFTVGLKSNVSEEQILYNKADIQMEFGNEQKTNTSKAYIVSPFALNKLIKPSVCRNETQILLYESRVDLQAGNQMILELSDVGGSFANPTVLKTEANVNLKDSISFNVPSALPNGNYKIRLRSTIPAHTSVGKGGYFEFSPVTPPALNVSTNIVNNTVCESDSVKFTFNQSTLKHKLMYTYFTKFNYAFIGFYSTTIEANGEFRVIGQDPNTGCEDTLEIKPIINPRPRPTIQLTTSRTHLCKNEWLSLLGNGMETYQFFRNDTSLGNKSLVDTILTQLKYSASYKVIGESSKGCRSYPSNVLNLVTNSLPKVTVSISPSGVCPGDSFYLFCGDASFYEVLRNDSIVVSKTPNTTAKTTAYRTNDLVQIRAIDYFGCGNLSGDGELLCYARPLAGDSKP